MALCIFIYIYIYIIHICACVDATKGIAMLQKGLRGFLLALPGNTSVLKDPKVVRSALTKGEGGGVSRGKRLGHFPDQKVVTTLRSSLESDGHQTFVSPKCLLHRLEPNIISANSAAANYESWEDMLSHVRTQERSLARRSERRVRLKAPKSLKALPKISSLDMGFFEGVPVE